MKQASFTPAQIRYLRGQAENRYEGMRGSRAFRNVDFLIYILTVVLVALAIRTFLAEPIRVDGDSMIPTLLNNEHMFVEKTGYWFDEPARGDIIICYYPGYTESCVKRVIGLPGDTVAVQGGAVYLNGVPLPEESYWQGTIYSETEPVVVGRDEVFVMGDNRNGSKDSRSASVGCIPYSKIEGRVLAVIWPIDAFTRIPRVAY